MGTTEGIAINPQESVKWYTKAAEQGNTHAQGMLIIAYTTGIWGIRPNRKQLFYWTRIRAKQGGDAGYQCDLGNMYWEGDGTLKDPKQALYWYKKSAMQGNAEAQCELGLMMMITSLRSEINNKRTTQKTKRSYIQGVFWLKKSAEQGNAEAQYRLGIAYSNGNGILVDKKKTAYWIKKSFKNGHEAAKEYWNKQELWKY